jgi:hypothetical protein
VSAKYQDLFTKSCELVEALLLKIYSEYKVYGKHHPSMHLSIKKVDSSGGKGDFLPEANQMAEKPEVYKKASSSKGDAHYRNY